MLRTDIKMDVGRSINPAIDYGQIEGAFVQGYGWSTMEESLWLRNGAIFTTGPGAYKIPGFADTPQVFNVSLLRDAEWPNLGSVHSSKGVGVRLSEPLVPMGVSCFISVMVAGGGQRAHPLPLFVCARRNRRSSSGARSRSRSGTR